MIRAVSKRSRSRVRAVVTAGVAATALTGGLLTAAPASAATEIHVDYPVSGTSLVKKTGGTMELGPGNLDATATVVPGTGADLTGNLNLPPAQTTFEVFGAIPVKATVTVTPTGPVTGTIVQGVVTTHAEAHIQLSDIWVGGVFYVPVGDECKTGTPVAMDLTSEPGFSIFTGGTVNGTYTIPEFADCTIFSGLLSSMVSGPDNTISLDLGRPVT